MATITYTDKVSVQVDPSVPNINKVTDDDMNEIKSVVNENADIVTVNQTATTGTKLLIESTDLDFQGGTEITNSYSQSTTLGYSANYVNNNGLVVSVTEPTNKAKVWFKFGEILFQGTGEQGDINGSTGQNQSSSSAIRSVGYIDVIGVDTINWMSTTSGTYYILGYDNDKNYLGIVGTNTSTSSYIRWTMPTTSSTSTVVTIKKGTGDEIYILNSSNNYEKFYIS